MPEDDSGLTILRQINAQLRYYLRLDPETLDDVQWARAWNDLVWIRKEEDRQSRG